VVDAKLRKEGCGYFLRAAQLPTEERNENASPVWRLWSGGFVRLPSMHSMRRERPKTPAYPQTQKSKENFSTCFARADVNQLKK